jgi:hypothetical protein
MIHSRPGYAPRTHEQQIAKLNEDMIPAINRKSPEEQAKNPPKLDLSHRKLKKLPDVPADVLKAADRAGPELILNPAPSPTPQVLEPGK